jgi:hypothetical protein
LEPLKPNSKSQFIPATREMRYGGDEPQPIKGGGKISLKGASRKLRKSSQWDRREVGPSSQKFPAIDVRFPSFLNAKQRSEKWQTKQEISIPENSRLSRRFLMPQG